MQTEQNFHVEICSHLIHKYMYKKPENHKGNDVLYKFTKH